MQNTPYYVTTSKISCEGQDKESGHPLIYLHLGTTEKVNCPYCGQEFVHQNQGDQIVK